MGQRVLLKGLIREWDEKEILCSDAHESAQKSLPLLLCFTIQSKKNTILRLRTSRIRRGICQVNKGLGVNLLFQTFRLTNIYRTMPQSPERVRIKISKHILQRTSRYIFPNRFFTILRCVLTQLTTASLRPFSPLGVHTSHTAPFISVLIWFRFTSGGHAPRGDIRREESACGSLR